MQIKLLLAIFLFGINVSESIMDRRHIHHPGLPPPPRPPPSPGGHPSHFLKKWEHYRPQPLRPINKIPPQRQIIPMSSMHAPVFVPPPMGPPVRQTPSPLSLANYWKTTKTSVPIRTIPEQKKPVFQTNREYDYHVQANTIPTHSIPIKQVGEKGPIHTIPAPNLSLADKPVVVEEVRKELKQHQYQVTESEFGKNGLNGQVVGGQHLGAQHIGVQHVNAQHINAQHASAPHTNYQHVSSQHDNSQHVNTQHINSQHTNPQHVNPQNVNSQLTNAQHLQNPQHLQTVPQQTQGYFVQNQDTDTLEQQPEESKLTSSELYQLLNSHFQRQQVFDYNSPVLLQPQQVMYDARNPSNDFSSTFIAADYNLKAESSLEDSNQNPSPDESSNDETFQLDDKPSKDDNISAYYTTLPNRQTAEILATLQAAGKINNNLMQLSQQQQNVQTPLTIYIPDKNSSVKENDEIEEEDLNEKQEESARTNFGSRIKNNQSN